jgi:hypothetical protein
VTNIRGKETGADVGGGAGLKITAGAGGGSLSGAKMAAGAGGSIGNIIFALELDATAELQEVPYSFNFTAGAGGNSAAGPGGAGGSITTVNLTLDGADRTLDYHSATTDISDAHLDTTVSLNFVAGDGGTGTKGGAGGAITGVRSLSMSDQVVDDRSFYLNYVVAGFKAGRGGNGTAGDGGAGGSIIMTGWIAGLTTFDEDLATPGNPERVPLLVNAGDGGNGTVKGGAGGNVDGIKACNGIGKSGALINHTHLTGAIVKAGNGGNGGTGDGGKGGDIIRNQLGTESNFRNLLGGRMIIIAGNGGDGGTTGGLAAARAKGGAGGGVLNSILSVADFSATLIDGGLLITAGRGGAGVAAGGLGGALNGIYVDTPQTIYGAPAVLTAGDGGAASATNGVGGKGGDVMNINSLKDLNSAISLLEAGNGGDATAGKGGAGGNASNIRVSGYLGRPAVWDGRLGAFDPVGVVGGFQGAPSTELAHGLAQGLFVGRGGNGVTAGLAGSVSNVAAAQIAAIAAAVDASGHFGVATKVSNVKALLIGYDVNGNTTMDYTGATPGTPSPSNSVPKDGFILAAALAQVTGTRTGFVFAA